jgi:small subunit ribosomal protein S21
MASLEQAGWPDGKAPDPKFPPTTKQDSAPVRNNQTGQRRLAWRDRIQFGPDSIGFGTNKDMAPALKILDSSIIDKAHWQVWRWDPLAEVRVQEGEPLENALRRFKRKVQQEDIIKEVKRHSYYLKPGEKARVKAALARKRNRKKARKEQD